MTNNRVLTGPICSLPHGLTTTSKLLAEGLSSSAISKRVARGALYRRYPGVYSLGPGELSREAQGMAAVLAVGPGAVLAHLSAAALFKTSRFAVPIPHVIVPRRHRPIEGIVIHECLGLDPLDVTVYRDIPVTTVARMLVDLSDVLTKWQLANVMHEAAFRRRLDLASLWRAIQRANGRRNLHVLKAAIALHLSGSAGTRSRLEDTFLALIAELPEPLVNTHLEGEEVDCHWPEFKRVVEVDGPGHQRPATRKDDARRDAKLRALGYTVIRFTHIEIERRPDEVLTRLLRCF